ncbi:MAG: NADH-quinone oxidoreductase subunit B [Gemmatimonadetes bacterium]|uniref:NADH-quinone oxidoreductase subunit B n=1 Tax=Candidatus Kutchimonas denitrificans TaxID=3056748 RepID=A0AAE4Z8Y4_9BACT|nr:NADH-quinone oxidoreductase subunit B [Gemmatimonadota bacterium]NIR75208.1 NADH-quinone oxidoreductase subunit B [Candidatus Kutchimonas denitrificans]NIS00146.1 NADH-quinone oxidoreductase subunit B [Gemmatimonadota bacterium]NIT65738.1 NADH-quinone oxidoreductase subunit B [Gemmatimonadota bacterium]NIU53016.1 NADH-quinone oxidoreductase subunit B [Gemmatimonadota bacterium]
MAKGDQDPGGAGTTRVETEIPRNWIIARLDDLVNWARRGSLWPMPFGTACCAIEMMATAASKYDMARYGMERMGYTPRQADVMLVAGRVAYKMAPVMRRIWDQMPQPKWCLSMGACASTGGVFDTYTMVQGIDTIVPVDVYVPGCPPRPEQLLYGLLMIQEKIRGESFKDPRPRAEGPEDVAKPQLSPEDVELVASPFGNSTFQNRVSGLESSSPILRPGDRKE